MVEIKEKPLPEICVNRLRNIKNAALCICEWADNQMNSKTGRGYQDVVEFVHFYNDLKMLSKNHDIDVREV